MPIMERQAAFRFEVFADFATREHCKGYGLHERSRLAHTNRRYGYASRSGQHRAAHQSANATLIGAHAMRGEAFHVLHVFVALARREPHIVAGHVMLQIDECFALPTNLPTCAASR